MPRAVRRAKNAGRTRYQGLKFMGFVEVQRLRESRDGRSERTLSVACR